MKNFVSMQTDWLLLLPESKTLEFKRDLSSLEPILKTIIAFANTAGGTLIIGHSQEETIGVKDVFKAEETLANAIADNIRPSILPDIEIITVKNKHLLVVKVAHWKAPFYLKKEGIPRGVYIRLGSTSRPIDPQLLAELQRSTLTLSFDAQPLPDLTMEALDPELMTRVWKKKMSEEKLRSLGILAPVTHRLAPSIGGLILFGKKEQRSDFVPDARVSCARFLGDTKSTILDRYEVEGTILDAIDEVPKFIARNTRLAAEILEMRRRDIPQYPPLAVREALINALAHADYSLQGARIQVAIFNDRLEIQSPGMFPFGFTLEDFKAGVSRIRNRVIARVFHELSFMEQWGSGYRRILEACHEGGFPEPQWEELGTAVRVTFYPHVQTLSFEERAVFHRPHLELMPREEALLKLFQSGEKLPFREIAKRIGFSISPRTLRYDLSQLKRKHLLTSRGKGRATLWLLQ